MIGKKEEWNPRRNPERIAREKEWNPRRKRERLPNPRSKWYTCHEHRLFIRDNTLLIQNRQTLYKRPLLPSTTNENISLFWIYSSTYFTLQMDGYLSFYSHGWWGEIVGPFLALYRCIAFDAYLALYAFPRHHLYSPCFMSLTTTFALFFGNT